jgi:hypothetical protein
MNQTKLSLADLLTVLGAAVFGFFCFLSLNFLSLGETVPSVVWAAVLALILGGLALGAKLLKRTSQNFKTCIIWEWVLLFLFAVVAIFALFPFSHYFAVSEQKDEIQEKVTANITQAESMFADYENYANNRLNIYESKLKSITAGKSVNPTEYSNYGFVAGTDDNTQVENKMFTLRAQLYPSNYEEMKQVDTDWLASSKATVANWKPIGIVMVMNEVESNLTSWKNELVQYSTFRAQGETANDFDYTLAFDDATGRITELDSPTSLSILYAIGLYALMLLSYFITKRHWRYPKLKMIFGAGGVRENEL